MLLSQLYATNYVPSCIVRVYSIVMMSIALCAVLDSLPSVLVSLWITVRVSFGNCFSPHEIIQQLLKHRKYHSRKQEIREVRETRSSYSLDTKYVGFIEGCALAKPEVKFRLTRLSQLNN